ncbi:mCG1032281 [Mus musculus]|nr:mCG1032281 [Mus musculus]
MNTPLASSLQVDGLGSNTELFAPLTLHELPCEWLLEGSPEHVHSSRESFALLWSSCLQNLLWNT